MRFIIYITICIVVSSCASLKEAGKVLRNEKQNTTDEFLVKKKEPLIIPPDLDKIPEPGSTQKKDINDEDKIKKILKAPKSTKNNNNSSTEDTILEKIKR
tara:strand:- start:228 stop:527 length:300 start_codon:yes stop_codon:yes gene_type:complete